MLKCFQILSKKVWNLKNLRIGSFMHLVDISVQLWQIHFKRKLEHSIQFIMMSCIFQTNTVFKLNCFHFFGIVKLKSWLVAVEIMPEPEPAACCCRQGTLFSCACKYSVKSAWMHIGCTQYVQPCWLKRVFAVHCIMPSKFIENWCDCSLLKSPYEPGLGRYQTWRPIQSCAQPYTLQYSKNSVTWDT